MSSRIAWGCDSPEADRREWSCVEDGVVAAGVTVGRFRRRRRERDLRWFGRRQRQRWFDSRWRPERFRHRRRRNRRGAGRDHRRHVLCATVLVTATVLAFALAERRIAGRGRREGEDRRRDQDAGPGAPAQACRAPEASWRAGAALQAPVLAGPHRRAAVRAGALIGHRRRARDIGALRSAWRRARGRPVDRGGCRIG